MSSTANYIAWRERRDLEDGARAKTRAVAATEEPAKTVPIQMIGKKVADLTGNKQAPDDLVEDNRKLFSEVVDNAKLDEIRTSAPKLAEWLNQQHNYALAKGGLDNLLPIAKTIARIGEAPKVPPLWQTWPADNLSLPTAAASVPFGDNGTNAVGPLRSTADRMGQAVEGGEEAGVPATPQTQEMPNASAAGLPAAAPVQTAVPATDGAGQSAPSEAFGAREDPSAGAAGTPAGIPVQTPSAVVPETPGTQENSSTGAAGGPASVPDKAATAAPKTEEAGQTSASSISTADETFIDAIGNAKPENYAQFHNAIDLRPAIPREEFHRLLDEMALGIWTPDNAKKALRSWLQSARNNPGANKLNPPNGAEGQQTWGISPGLPASPNSLITFYPPDLGNIGGQVLEAPRPNDLATLDEEALQGPSWWNRVSLSFNKANAKLVVQSNEFTRDLDVAITRSQFGRALHAAQIATDRALFTNDDGSPNLLGRMANWSRSGHGGHPQLVGEPEITPEQQAEEIAHRDLGPFHRAASETLKEIEVKGLTPMSYKDINGVGSALSFVSENVASALPATLTTIGAGPFLVPVEVILQGGDVNAELKERTQLSLEQRVSVATAAGTLMTLLDRLELSRLPIISKLNGKVGEAAKKTLGDGLADSRVMKVMGDVLENAVTQSVAGTGQEAVKIGATGLSGGQYKEGEIFERFLQAAITGFAKGDLIRPGEDAVEVFVGGAVERMSSAAGAARAAVVDQTVLSEFSGLADASKSQMQSPELLRGGVEAAFKRSRFEKVHLSGKALADYLDAHHIDPSSFFATMEGVTRQDFDTALETGADLPIPIATYVMRIAGSDADAALRSHMRFDPRQLTAVEAKALIESVLKAIGEVSGGKNPGAGSSPAKTARPGSNGGIPGGEGRAGKTPDTTPSGPSGAASEGSNPSVVGATATGGSEVKAVPSQPQTLPKEPVPSNDGASDPPKKSLAEQKAILAEQMARKKAQGPYGAPRNGDSSKWSPEY